MKVTAPGPGTVEKEAFISIRPRLLSRVSFALLGIDPQRPLVDSLIEN